MFNARLQQHFIIQSYRQLQIVGLLCNECLQAHFWPAMEFLGGLAVIALLYVFIVCYNWFSFFLKAGVLCAFFVIMSIEQ